MCDSCGELRSYSYTLPFNDILIIRFSIKWNFSDRDYVDKEPSVILMDIFGFDTVRIVIRYLSNNLQWNDT